MFKEIRISRTMAQLNMQRSLLILPALLCLACDLFSLFEARTLHFNRHHSKFPRLLDIEGVATEGVSGDEKWESAVEETNVQNIMSPDVELESRLDQCALINRRGFPCETHYAITTDGFILMVFRIPPAEPSSNLPILLQHGVFDWYDKISNDVIYSYVKDHACLKNTSDLENKRPVVWARGARAPSF